MATIRDVARACGLSAMTVSAVLNGRKGEASAETRERVLRVVAEMGYQPNAIARGLTRRRMNTLGVVMSYEDKPSLASDRYLSPVLDGIFAACKRNHQKTLVITEEGWEETARHMPSYADGHSDALIFILPLMPSENLLALQKRTLPIVLIGEDRPEPALSVVDLNNVQAGYDAAVFLLSRGHRRIAHLRGDDFLASSAQRERGFRQALAEWNVFCDPSLVLSGSYGVSSGAERAHALLSRPLAERPTALFCGDDWIAQGARQAALDCGLRVPQDVSLIGVNDNKEATEMQPSLTTISQPLRLMGEQAIEIALSQISQRPAAGEKRLLRGELIVRGSVAALLS